MLAQLTEEQVDEMARIKDIVMAKVRVEVDVMAEMMVSNSNGEFFGATEFVVRDRCHKIGAHEMDAALEERIPVHPTILDGLQNADMLVITGGVFRGTTNQWRLQHFRRGIMSGVGVGWVRGARLVAVGDGWSGAGVD